MALVVRRYDGEGAVIGQIAQVNATVATLARRSWLTIVEEKRPRVVQDASPPEIEVPVKQFERRTRAVSFKKKRAALSKTID